MNARLHARINEIHRRVRKYRKHENDPTNTPEKVRAARELRSHALRDIELLLALLGQKK